MVDAVTGAAAMSRRVAWPDPSVLGFRPFRCRRAGCAGSFVIGEPMARQCEICGKKPITGWNPQSVGMNRKRALRRWLPNLQPMTIVRDGRTLRIRACSRCRRTATKV